MKPVKALRSRPAARKEEVVLDAGHLGHDRAEDLAAGREVDAEELLDAVVPADVVGDGER